MQRWRFRPQRRIGSPGSGADKPPTPSARARPNRPKFSCRLPVRSPLAAAALSAGAALAAAADCAPGALDRPAIASDLAAAAIERGHAGHCDDGTGAVDAAIASDGREADLEIDRGLRIGEIDPDGRLPSRPLTSLPSTRKRAERTGAMC